MSSSDIGTETRGGDTPGSARHTPTAAAWDAACAALQGADTVDGSRVSEHVHLLSATRKVLEAVVPEFYVERTDDMLPFVVLTLRRSANDVTRLDTVALSTEWEAHDVAEVLAATGQPTWMFDLASDMDVHRYDDEEEPPS